MRWWFLPVVVIIGCHRRTPAPPDVALPAVDAAIVVSEAAPVDAGIDVVEEASIIEAGPDVVDAGRRGFACGAKWCKPWEYCVDQTAYGGKGTAPMPDEVREPPTAHKLTSCWPDKPATISCTETGWHRYRCVFAPP